MKVILSNKIINLLNFRIEQEEYSSRLYKSMSVWLNFNGFIGAAKEWEKYSNEEMGHAQWSYNYLLDLDIRPTTPLLQQPPNEFKSFPEIIKMSYEHEKEVTEQCQALAKACVEEGDFMTLSLAQKYLNEQVDEIAKTTTLLDKLDAFGTDKIALRLLDNELNG